MKATLGRIVHCTGPGLEARPAIVVAVNDDGSVNLQLFEDRHAGYVYMRDMKHESETHRGLYWFWPPRC